MSKPPQELAPDVTPGANIIEAAEWPYPKAWSNYTLWSQSKLPDATLGMLHAQHRISRATETQTCVHRAGSSGEDRKAEEEDKFLMINHHRKKIQQKKMPLAPGSFAMLTWSWLALCSKQSCRPTTVGTAIASGPGRRHRHGMEEGGGRGQERTWGYYGGLPHFSCTPLRFACGGE